MLRMSLTLDIVRQGSVDRGSPSASQIGNIEVHETLAGIQDAWGILHRHADGSPYQSFAWFSAWLEEIGTPGGWTSCVVVVRDDVGAPLLLAPLVQRRRFGVTFIEFAGGKHSNLNMPLIASSPLWGRDEWLYSRLIQEIRRSKGGAVVLRFVNMPMNWRGRSNPLAALGARKSPSDFHMTTFDDNLETWTKRKLSRDRCRKLDYNVRNLMTLGELRWLRGADENEVGRIVEAFIHQKSEQLRAKRIPNPFRSDAFRRFLQRGATHRFSQGDPVIELFALEIDSAIVATLGAAVAEDAFSVMFLSLSANSPAAKFSPGELLLWHVAKLMHFRGLRRFDLGIGDAPYKTRFCNDVLPLYDAFVGLSIRAFIIAKAMSLLVASKGWLKRHPGLFSTARAALCLPELLSRVTRIRVVRGRG